MMVSYYPDNGQSLAMGRILDSLMVGGREIKHKLSLSCSCAVHPLCFLFFTSTNLFYIGQKDLQQGGSEIEEREIKV